jgi:hypothetical protein
MTRAYKLPVVYVRLELLPDKKSIKNSQDARDNFKPVFNERLVHM